MVRQTKGRGAESWAAAASSRCRVKTAKGRKIASTRWLQRQLNDPYVEEAKRRGYRSRAAFKLAEIDDKYRLLRPGHGRGRSRRGARRLEPDRGAARPG